MKITCEHCGTIIDTEKDKKCSNCGAPYSKNKKYKKVEEINDINNDYDLREREADIRKKEITNDIMEKQLNTVKRISFIPFLIFLIALFVFGLIFYNVFKASNKQMNKAIDNMTDTTNVREEKEEEKEKTVSFNETAEMENYDIICDKVREYEYEWYEEGNHRPSNLDYYAFHIVFKNKSTKNMTLYSNFKVTYTDENGNEDINAKSHSSNSKESSQRLDFFAQPNSKYSGYIFFELPSYVKSVKIIYDKTTINVENFR